MNLNELQNKGFEKLARENTAFRDCRKDMSDVNFEIGKSSYTAKAFLVIVLAVPVFGGRILLRRYAGNPDRGMSTLDVFFWIFIGIILVLSIILAVAQKSKPTISVSGKTIFYNGSCWTSDEISCVKCSKWLERVEVYSNGKKVISFPWELDNSELLIAWAKKCGIRFDDKRIKRF